MAAAVVLAAGESSRFGSQKLIAPVRGEPMLNRTIRSLLEGGVADVIVVVSATGPGPLLTPAAIPLLADPRVRLVTNADPSRGMFSSIQAGCAAAAGAEPLLILPGDMPYVRSSTVAAVVAACASGRTIVSPRHHGKRGHPIALPSFLQREVLAADAGANLKILLEAHDAARVYVEVDDEGILRDVDTPGELT